jgi:para-aminobenzoate synthetase component 2
MICRPGKLAPPGDKTGTIPASHFLTERSRTMILLIDNYDSFTWNLYQYFCELGAQVEVRRNDVITLADIDSLSPEKIVISPGPCTPDESGVSLDVIRHYAGKLPLLGVCLGHQAIGQVFGARIVRAQKVMHGKTSPVTHTGKGVFHGLNNPLTVTRYHSLVIEPASLPDCFDVTAWSDTQEIMGIRHRQWDLEGVQFHPESILSEQGHELLANFLSR